MARFFDNHRLAVIADALNEINVAEPDTGEIVEQMRCIFRDMSERCLGIIVHECRPNSSVWDEDPDYPAEDLMIEVSRGDTRLGRPGNPITIRGTTYPSQTYAASVIGVAPSCITAAKLRGTLDQVGLRKEKRLMTNKAQ